MERAIRTADAVVAYSQAATDGSLVFTAGQIPRTPDRGPLDDEPIATQADRALPNGQAVPASEGLELRDVVKMTVSPDDIEDSEAMSHTYAGFFDEESPARSAVEVTNLSKGVGVEIEAIATTE
ncbi:Rid family hydrolase [Haloarcula sp. 1CSR25-25]|uniref:Rid family hydrolase n=1 Tax=Haloarcula sp. 1CSR25-25 TaxID=2862545 RepID=UPI00289536D3|nr:Rid family hydrolase [Haloarcula sp. 1CSR25-25]MDT3435785.1 RidA family protein [Haloarcula sp. 1CSR25-25]